MMSQQKFDPVKEFVALRDTISKTVGQKLRDVTGAGNFPAVDVYETEAEVIIYTQPMVGVIAERIEVSMENDELVISGETQHHSNVPEEAYLYRELYFGPFSRQVNIPRKVKADEARASFKDNVLTITLPKQETITDQIIGVTPAE